MILHRLDFDLTQAPDGCHRRARHPGEKHTRHHIGLRQTATNTAHPDPGEFEETVGNAAGIHQTPRQREQRNRQKDEVINPADHFVWNCRQGNVTEQRQ